MMNNDKFTSRGSKEEGFAAIIAPPYHRRTPFQADHLLRRIRFWRRGAVNGFARLAHGNVGIAEMNEPARAGVRCAPGRNKRRGLR